MDDISLAPRPVVSRGEGERPPRNAGARAGACVLIALTVAVLVPPAFYVWLLASDNGTDGLANHANHVAAGNVAILVILVPAGGAALGAVATLLSRRRTSTAGRVAAMAAGEFMASLMLTAGGILWVLSHAQFTF